MPEQQIILSAEQANRLLSYLAHKPYIEVKDLIAMIQSAAMDKK